jgi:anti-anti-sigma regulatory factor
MLGGTIEIANVTDSIRRVLELSGILKIIKITDLEEMAG